MQRTGISQHTARAPDLDSTQTDHRLDGAQHHEQRAAHTEIAIK